MTLRTQEDIIEEYADLQGPSLLKRTLGLQRRHHGLYIGSSGRFEPALMTVGKNLESSNLSPGISFRHAGEEEIFMLCPDQGTKDFEAEHGDLDSIEELVAPHGKALVKLYFRTVHPSFPILHKNVYLEKYERTHREFSPVLLAAVYILAAEYWYYSPELSSFEKPNINALETLALKSMNDVIHRPKLSTVEAGLLLLQRSKESSWPLTAQMVAIGQDLGLHRDCSDWDIPEWEKGLRRRLSWALFIQDKWASLAQGRPSHISRSDWTVKPLSEQDFPENFTDENDEEGSTEVETGRTLFTWMVSLTQILSDILVAFYSGAAEVEIRESQTIATSEVLRKAKPLQIRLKEWAAALPHCLGMEHVKARKLSSAGSLHLAYWATELSLHRCIIRTLDSCADTQLSRICQHAALIRVNSAMKCVERLKPEHWQSFWYYASEFNFGLIGLFQILLSTSFSSQHDIDVGISSLNDYTWTLKVSQKNASFLQRAITTIDLAARCLQQRLLRNNDVSLDRDWHDQAGQVKEPLTNPEYPNKDKVKTLNSLQLSDPTAVANDNYDNVDDTIIFGTHSAPYDYLSNFMPPFDEAFDSHYLACSRQAELEGISGRSG